MTLTLEQKIEQLAAKNVDGLLPERFKADTEAFWFSRPYVEEIVATCAVQAEVIEDADTALAEFEGRMKAIGGCGDGYCVVTGPAKGMHTNGGCRCYRDEMKAQRAMRAADALRRKLSTLRIAAKMGR